MELSNLNINACRLRMSTATRRKLLRPPSQCPDFQDIKTSALHQDCNLNNVGFCEDEMSPELTLMLMVQLILIALQTLKNPKGSTLRDIRKILYRAGVIDETTDIRRAMIVALKYGLIARPVWAVKAGIYGIYVEGDGVPIYAGRKSRPKQRKHRKDTFPSKTEKKKTQKARVLRRNNRQQRTNCVASRRAPRKPASASSGAKKRKVIPRR
ncbi:hypothetical protein BgiMline_035255 [Biomphalaria glabrata]|nr:hypothetical protein BgiMline_026118 [Biomphalaria glabrata]